MHTWRRIMDCITILRGVSVGVNYLKTIPVFRVFPCRLEIENVLTPALLAAIVNAEDVLVCYFPRAHYFETYP